MSTCKYLMTASNFAKSLNAFCSRAPFRPFVVELVSGDRFQVDHPEALATRGGTAVFFSPEGDIRLFDHEGVSQLVEHTLGKKRRATKKKR